jgi:radical SAM protein with 4Fe4S-binding SPASM domain
MANVLLTQRCIRSCPYCFAKKYMADSPDEETLSWQDLIYIADLLQSSGENHVSLLGGEPTLHPHFVDMVIYLLERGFHVNVFTSGVLSDKMLADADSALSGVHPDQLSFVCNVNNPKKTPFSELESVSRFLKTFGHLTTLGFNIYQPQFDLDFIFDWINKYGLKRFIRLGLAHPIPHKKNAFVKIEQMQEMATHLSDYLPIFERFRVKVGLDCGYPMCAFTDEQLGKLYKAAGGHITFGCGAAIDIGVDMNVWACFPLANYHQKSVYDFDSIHEIKQYYEEQHQRIRAEVGGIFEECDECKYREEHLCQGGCAAQILSKFVDEPKIRMKEIYQ